MTVNHEAFENTYKAFLKRVVETEKVWILRDAEGFAWCESNDEDESEAVVLLFFSDKELAERVQKSEFADYEVSEIPLYDFLFQWLLGMTEDGVYAGPDYTAELEGVEVDAEGLQAAILETMPRELFDAYTERNSNQ